MLVGTIKKDKMKCGFGNICASNDDANKGQFLEEWRSIIEGSEVPCCLARDYNGKEGG
ncbi:hypothetical protein PTKIN_Ptkin15bG0019100 [Pterospermum kingtungense]